MSEELEGMHPNVRFGFDESRYDWQLEPMQTGCVLLRADDAALPTATNVARAALTTAQDQRLTLLVGVDGEGADLSPLLWGTLQIACLQAQVAWPEEMRIRFAPFRDPFTQEVYVRFEADGGGEVVFCDATDQRFRDVRERIEAQSGPLQHMRRQSVLTPDDFGDD